MKASEARRIADQSEKIGWSEITEILELICRAAKNGKTYINYYDKLSESTVCYLDVECDDGINYEISFNNNPEDPCTIISW